MGISIKKPLGNNPKRAIANIATAGLYDVAKNAFGSPQEPSMDYGNPEGDYAALADRFGLDASKTREGLASSLTDSGTSLFKSANPYLLEDLNARGLFTSPSAVNQSQSDALGKIANENRTILNDYDTDVLNQRYAILGGGLGAKYDTINSVNQDAMSRYLAKRSSRDSLISSVLGGAGSIGAGLLKR